MKYARLNIKQSTFSLHYVHQNNKVFVTNWQTKTKWEQNAIPVNMYLFQTHSKANLEHNAKTTSDLHYILQISSTLKLLIGKSL